MSATSHDSSTQYHLEPISPEAPGAPGGSESTSSSTGVWLDGDVLSCACPDCGAPMSIRLWLMVADCFRCGASIELSEEQEQEALRLLRQYEKARRSESQQAAAAITPTMLPKARPHVAPAKEAEAEPATTETPGETGAKPRATAAGPMPESTAPSTSTAPPLPARRRRIAASEVHRGARAHIRNIYEKGGAVVFWSQFFKDLPAWLISGVLHAIVILLLGMWISSTPDDLDTITLSTSVSYDDLDGDQGEFEPIDPKAFEFEDPGSIEVENLLQDAGSAVEPDPEMEPVDVTADELVLPGVTPESVIRPIGAPDRVPVGRMFAGRDPNVRKQNVYRSGGTTQTEAAVARALKFLARHQRDDGRWSLNKFNDTPDCDDTCTHPGREQSDIAATSLALLPFLGAGQTHLEGQYTDEIFKAVRWLVEHQKEDGGLLDGGRMYAHGQAAIALSEAFALSGDEQLREPAQRALNFIVRAQHSAGGWRYAPGEAGDTSVVGWQLMALKSGQMAYLHVPPKTFEQADHFLDLVAGNSQQSRYCYQRGRGPDHVMTAEGLLCRQYLGWPKDHPGLEDGVRYLLKEHPPDEEHPNIYYWYYATQVMHHIGGSSWTQWNDDMRRLLVRLQETKGHAAGSWTPLGAGHHAGFADRGGRIYMTALAACILEVYYRHMPIYSEDALLRFE